ncbi:lytic polysaccharide monooxygenase [Photobacterium sp. CCB-ST2H9]|uniref:lytic polysaccharide monooxygenase auxiliary activity family 9 protein n=1 Tax=Photobacterium sp. CCB-ST2H9 TaxID=2912855 RepID=UPI0020055431|nr:lytic polysaccharide monooxygenase auxiliary activity family 9 protein [Photobacterium sp. CCB-ST2H9]UTM59779.1 lytic polysaccharide monooxygenase [Photobacterium sp. CCB-ST2H9]
MNQPVSNINQLKPKHGYVINPPSRGAYAVEQGWWNLGEWHVVELEGGKNFPAQEGGAAFYESTDVNSFQPPVDGLILSGGHEDVRQKLNYTDQQLIAEGKTPWPRLTVPASKVIDIEWRYTMAHKTRGYVAFITRDGWDSDQVITRNQLESKPFFEDIYPEAPYWEHDLPAKIHHQLVLPDHKQGHHVVVLLWLVADTGNAFYQTFDFDFG